MVNKKARIIHPIFSTPKKDIAKLKKIAKKDDLIGVNAKLLLVIHNQNEMMEWLEASLKNIYKKIGE